MDLFMQGLNVTIYGLGIVFLALLVLMVTIMILSKVFEVTTGKELFTAVPTVSPSAAVSAPASVSSAPQVAQEQPAEVVEEEVVAGEVLGQVTAPLPGKILSVSVKPGDAVHKGDEVCVIEAMKMGNSIKSEHDGVIGEVLVSAGDSVTFGAPLVTIASPAGKRVVRKMAPAPAAAAPAAPTPAAAPAPAAPAAFSLGASGQKHEVEVAPGAGTSVAVAIDRQTFQVQRDQSDPRKFVVDGKTHTVEIQQSAGDVVTVVVDGIARTIDLSGASVAATAVAAAPAFGPGSFKMALGVLQHQVEIKDATETGATILVDGTAFKVERGKANGKVVIVNGKPFVVEVRDRASDSANVLIDGEPRTVRVLDVASAPAAAPKPAPAPVAPSTSGPAVAAAAPAPAPAPAAPAAAPAPSGPGEQVTAPLPGKIISVAVKAGDVVRKGDELCVIEAMKMGNSIKAQRDGTVQQVVVSPGDSVAFGAPLLVMG